MKETKFSKISDFVFGNLLVFFVAYVWTRFFWKDQRINILLSIFVTILVFLIYNYFHKKKQAKIKSNQQDLQNAENISVEFLFLTKTEIIKKFAKNIEKKYKIKQERQFLFVNDNILYPIFESQEITDKDILTAYLKIKNMDCKKIIFVCYNFSNSAKTIIEKISDKKVVLLNKTDAYINIYKPLDFEVPKIEKSQQKQHKKAKDYLQIAFNKSNTKNYFIVSAFLLFGSFVLRYNLYYLIFASITTIFALYSHFNTKFNVSKKEEFIE